MKIKRLTAGLAVAAMAATFFAAAPIVSANAAAIQVMPAVPVYSIDAGSIANGDTLKIPIFDRLALDTRASTMAASIDDIVPGSVLTIADWTQFTGPNAVTPFVSYWLCGNTSVWDSTDTIQLTNFGTITCDATGNLIYTPSLVMGVRSSVDVVLHYEATAQLTAKARDYPATQDPVISGVIYVTVTPPAAPVTCDKTAACLGADVQAYGKKDKANSVKIDLLTPNIYNVKTNPSGVLLAADQPSLWGLAAVNNPTSIDTTLSPTTLGTFATYTYAKGANSITFTPPANWSGTVTYEYVIGKYNAPGGLLDQSTTLTGSVTFTVHPTLAAFDDIYSDQGAKVTIPVLEQSIIGSKPFQDANCVFANSKNKTTQANVGSISNKGGSKDPVFTPVADFVGDVTLSCTVADVWDPISNAQTVVIHVGTPAPTATTPAPVVPACTTKNCDGTLVSTGGSLAAPMSSGLAAVVLMLAAGAGILVVRRRTALAG